MGLSPIKFPKIIFIGNLLNASTVTNTKKLLTNSSKSTVKTNHSYSFFVLSFVGHLAQLYFNECDGSIFILNSGFKENDIMWRLYLILISVESWTKPLKMLIWILTEFKATDLEKFQFCRHEIFYFSDHWLGKSLRSQLFTLILNTSKDQFELTLTTFV